MAKDIQFNIDARDGLKRGVDALANAISGELSSNHCALRSLLFGKIYWTW